MVCDRGFLSGFSEVSRNASPAGDWFLTKGKSTSLWPPLDVIDDEIVSVSRLVVRPKLQGPARRRTLAAARLQLKASREDVC